MFRVYEHIYNLEIAIASRKLLTCSLSVEEARSCLPNQKWKQCDRSLETEPMLLQSGRVKYYSIHQQFTQWQ